MYELANKYELQLNILSAKYCACCKLLWTVCLLYAAVVVFLFLFILGMPD